VRCSTLQRGAAAAAEPGARTAAEAGGEPDAAAEAGAVEGTGAEARGRRFGRVSAGLDSRGLMRLVLWTILLL